MNLLKGVLLMFLLASYASAHPPPGVVQVLTENGVGTGFFVTERLVATCYHVIANAKYVDVEYQHGKRTGAVVVDYDGDNDLALLLVDYDESIPLKFTEHELDFGDDVVMWGYPYGHNDDDISPSFARGYVMLPYAYTEDGDVKVSVSLAPGNSGSPILYKGKVAGIAKALKSKTPTITFATSAIHLKDLIENYLENE